MYPLCNCNADVSAHGFGIELRGQESRSTGSLFFEAGSIVYLRIMVSEGIVGWSLLDKEDNMLAGGNINGNRTTAPTYTLPNDTFVRLALECQSPNIPCEARGFISKSPIHRRGLPI